MFELPDVKICRDRYTEEERQATGRVRTLMQIADPEYPDARDCDEVKPDEMKKIRNKMNKELKKSGIICKGIFVANEGFPSVIDLWGCNLSDRYVRRYGNNIDPVTKRKTRDMGFHDIVEATDAISRTLEKFSAEGVIKVKDPLTKHITTLSLPYDDMEIVFSELECNLVYVDYDSSGEIKSVIDGQSNSYLSKAHNYLFLRRDYYHSDGKGRAGFWANRELTELMDEIPVIKPSKDVPETEEEMLKRVKLGRRVSTIQPQEFEGGFTDIFSQLSKRRRKSQDD